MAYTQVELEEDFEQLGVLRGGILFVHSSYKSLGEVVGGAEAVIAALESVLGAEGTLLMPSFNMASRNRTERAATWNRETTPSSVGYLTECFRRMPVTLRSEHYSHSVAARGARAEWITSGHERQEGWVSPWDRPLCGHTYGTHSPMIRALDAHADVLLLGVGYECLTYSHVAEVSDYNRRLLTDPAATYRFVDRAKVGEWWEAHGIIARGNLGDADCRLFKASDFVEAIAAELERGSNEFYPPDT